MTAEAEGADLKATVLALDDTTALRPDGPALVFSAAARSAFVRTVKAG
ncbi:DUF397 domain-containing protein [Streptomyces sp. NPDC050617]